MKKRFHQGLVVGKFCPLHLGHELVLAEAQAQCEEVAVISYTRPAFSRCDADARERWLATRFPSVRRLVLDEIRFETLAPRLDWPELTELPHNDAADDIHRELVARLCDRVLNVRVDAVFTSEDYGDGFADVLSRYFQRRWASPDHKVQHICVDRQRRSYPVSGTSIRQNPHAQREAMAPEVYADFVERVCLLGGESSGKSTLAKALADKLNTVRVPEYGRELWEEKAGKLTYDDLYRIAATQVEREQLLARQARRWLICDTSPLTTLFYSLEMFGRADPALVELAKRPYEHIFLCVPDFPFMQDGTRRDESFRQQQHSWYLRELGKNHLPYILLEGSIDQRLDAMVSAIQ